MRAGGPDPGPGTARHVRARRRLVSAGLIVTTVLFLVLAGCVLAPASIPQDNAMLLWLRGHAGATLDAVFVAITRAGYGHGVIPAQVLLTLGLLAWKRRRQALFAFVSFAGSALLNQAIKHLVQRERPSLWVSIAPESSYSFPSGHAMAVATLACVCVILAWHARGRWAVLAAAIVAAAAVGVSRLYLGVHWPSDVLAGWAAGVAWVLCVHLLVHARAPARIT